VLETQKSSPFEYFCFRKTQYTECLTVEPRPYQAANTRETRNVQMASCKHILSILLKFDLFFNVPLKGMISESLTLTILIKISFRFSSQRFNGRVFCILCFSKIKIFNAKKKTSKDQKNNNWNALLNVYQRKKQITFLN
jgi:hypothetical protein